MEMKCPVCGGRMEKQYGAFGDLHQSNSSRYVCMQCSYGGPSDDDIFAEAVRKIQKERKESSMEQKKEVYITLTDYYRTFDGGDKTTYRFPIRVGVISYDEDMTWVEGDFPRYKKLEVVEITEEEVSFVVGKEFLDGKESAIHTLKLSGEEKVFERITEEFATIYDEHYDYEQIHRLTIRTEN